MRFLSCVSIFVLCLIPLFVTGTDPGPCCNLQDHVCSSAVTKEWAETVGGRGTPTESNLQGVLTCDGVVIPPPPAPQPPPGYEEATLKFKCATAVLYKAESITDTCTADDNKTTSSKSSNDTKVCKYLYRCEWDDKAKKCVTKDTYPKEYKVQYLVTNTGCTKTTPTPKVDKKIDGVGDGTEPQ